MDDDLDKIITVIGSEHGEFKIRNRDHVGENDEEIAYGCSECCGFIKDVHFN